MRGEQQHAEQVEARWRAGCERFGHDPDDRNAKQRRRIGLLQWWHERRERPEAESESAPPRMRRIRGRQRRACLYCYGPLSNGAVVCSDECDEGWWRVVPTIDGELFEPGR